MQTQQITDGSKPTDSQKKKKKKKTKKQTKTQYSHSIHQVKQKPHQKPNLKKKTSLAINDNKQMARAPEHISHQ